MTQQTGIQAQALGRITSPPQLSRSLGGVAVCRFTVATEAGPASSPLVKPIYIKGDPSPSGDDLAVRCKRGLGVGDLVYVEGAERQRPRRRGSVQYIESAIEAEQVRLRERASQAGCPEAPPGAGAAPLA